MSVITITLNPCIDKVCSVEHMVPEHKLTARNVQSFPGGGGINVARVIHRLGHKACALWSNGGAMGQLLHSLLDAENVSHRPVPMQGDVRQNIIITEETTGQQYRVGMPGPALEQAYVGLWRRELLDVCTQATRYVVFSGSVAEGSTLDGYETLLCAVPKEIRLVVDTKGEALRRALQRGVFLIKPNLRELQELTGVEQTTDEAIKLAARELIAAGRTQVVVVSLGAEGAMAVTSDQCERFAAPEVPAVSKVGAGDSMLGGIITGLVDGRTLFDAVRLGVAAGTAAVMSEGTQLCSRQNTERLLPQTHSTGK